MRTCRRNTLLAVAVGLAALSPASSQAVEAAPVVYVADGQTCGLVAYTGTAPAVILDGLFCSARGMSVDDLGNILVADENAGVYRVNAGTAEVEPIDTNPHRPSDVYPDCLSEDVYFISHDHRALFVEIASDTMPAQLCLAFDHPPLDLQVYPMGEAAGRVLVLVSGGEGPPYLAQFRRTGLTTFEELEPIVEEATSDAVGFAIRPNGGIVLLDSVLGMFDVGPGGELTHFGPGRCLHWDDIDVGADGTIYVTDPAAGLTHRFTPAGEWILPSLNCVVGVPTAVAAVGFTPSFPGSGVSVHPAPGVEIVFEEITEGGYTTAVATESESRVSPGGNTLPEYAGAPEGRSGFVYVDLATTAVHENLVQVDVLFPGSRLFFAHGTGGVFEDVTVEGTIEDARGVISRFSEVVVVDDTRPLTEVVDHKFARLFEVLSPDPAARRRAVEVAKKALRGKATVARRLYLAGDVPGAIEMLASLNADTRDFAGTAIPSSSAGPGGNLAGEILSRSKTLMFSLGLLRSPQRDSALERSATPALALSCTSPTRGGAAMQLTGPAGAHVTVRLYTAAGRLVGTVFDGEVPGGAAALEWDGTDDAGRRAPSGVYFARADCGAAVATGRFVLVR
jgi:hypothetical protein